MRIDILTLFPGMFAPLNDSIIKRAGEKGIVDLRIENIRDYTLDKHHITDERLYGGGAGMVMKPDPIFSAVESVREVEKPRIIFTSPQGKPFSQKLAQQLAKEDQLIFVCGHYEGIDERAIELLATDVISIGDYVLTGGEIPAMAMVDAVVRLLPGALGHELAADEESFNGGLLEYPQYTRPPVFQGLEVPEVLLSGNHADISCWRRQKSLERTYENRPDLLESALLTSDDKRYLEELAKSKLKPFRFFTALLHYPVYNKKKQVINTCLTNLDLHDISRAAATYKCDGFYLVQPLEGQRQLMQDLLDYWREGFGSRYNPNREEALSLTSLAVSLEEVKDKIRKEYGEEPKIIATSAKIRPDAVSYKDMRNVIEKEGGNYLMLLGTGWGLTDEILDVADYCLRPVYGKGEYNHLSVRSAASIMLDRLLGEKNSR